MWWNAYTDRAVTVANLFSLAGEFSPELLGTALTALSVPDWGER